MRNDEHLAELAAETFADPLRDFARADTDVDRAVARLRLAWTKAGPAPEPPGRSYDGPVGSSTAHGGPTAAALQRTAAVRRGVLANVADAIVIAANILDRATDDDADDERAVARRHELADVAPDPTVDDLDDVLDAFTDVWGRLDDAIRKLVDDPLAWDDARMRATEAARPARKLRAAASRAWTALIEPAHPAAVPPWERCSDPCGRGAHELGDDSRGGVCGTCRKRLRRAG